MSPLSSRRWRLLFSAFSVSVAGDQFARIAVYPKAGSDGASLSLIIGLAFLQSVPAFAISPFAGILGDRFNRRNLLVFSDIARFGILTAMAISQNLGTLAIGVFFLSVFSAIFRPIEASLEADLLQSDQIVSANALRASAAQTLSVLGPAAAGLALIWLSAQQALLLDAFSFLASAALLMWVRDERQRSLAPALLRARDIATDGLQQLFSRRDFGALTILMMLTLLILGMQGPLFFGFVQQALKGSGTSYGFVVSSMGLGGLVASLLLAKFKTPISIQLLLATLAFDGLALVGFASSRALVASCIFMSALGAIGTVYGIGTRSYLQMHSDPSRRASLFGWFYGLQAPVEALSLAVGAALTIRFSAAGIFLASGYVEILVALTAITFFSFSRNRVTLTQVRRRPNFERKNAAARSRDE